MNFGLKLMLSGPAVRSGEDVQVADGRARVLLARRRPKAEAKSVDGHDAAEPNASATRSGANSRTRVQTPDHASQSPARVLAALGRQASRPLAFAIGGPMLAGLLILPQLWLFASVIQQGVVGGVRSPALFAQVLAIAALIAVRVCLIWWGEGCGSRAASDITLALRKTLFTHLLGQRPDWTAAHPSGELSGAIVDHIAALDPYFARYLPAMALAVTLPIAFAVTAIAVEPIVGLLFLVSAPLIPVFMALVGWGAETASAEHQQAFLRLSGFFADRLRGLVTLKLLGRAQAETLRLREAGEDLRARTLGVLRIAFLSSAVLEFFAALGVAGVALYIGLTYLGFLHIHALPLTLQTGLFCLMLAPEVYLPLRQFAAHYHDRAAAKAAVAALAALFETIPSLTTKDLPTSATFEQRHALPGAIAIKASSLTVTSPDRAQPVLTDIGFTVVPGQHVAVIGASGSGKSTLLEALAGLRAFDGAIEIGGMQLTDLPDHALRTRVAVLGQRPRLFHGTIADNIRFGRADAGDDEVAQAAELSGVMRFATTLPDGLGTAVGEGGLGLSGGEIHRVALARIFLRDPGLILLDEPTAHLDPATEQAVLSGILAFAAGRTLIVATHASAVIDRMDRVMRIEGHGIFTTRHRPSGAKGADRRKVIQNDDTRLGNMS